MSTPIPEDVMQVARKLAKKAVYHGGVDWATDDIALALLARDERAADLLDALMRIQQWCEAYPIDVFPEPDFKRARQLLAAGGIAIDAVSASDMRHVANGIKSIAASAIRDRSKT